MRTFLLLTLLSLCPLNAVAQNPLEEEGEPAREELLRFTQGLERLYARFSQTLVSAEGELMDAGTGEVWMQRPDLFRWQYEGEFPETIVADGERLWMYDVALEQVTLREQSALAENSPLMLLTDAEGIDRQFTVRDLGDTGEYLLLELTVNNPQAEFDRVLLGLRDGELRLMTMEDAFGMRTEIRFEALQRNPELDPELFHFTPPMGVDVIGDPGAEAE